MDHRYSEASQRIQPTNAMQSSHPEGVKAEFKQPKIIKYTGGVTSASGDRGDFLFKRPNNVSKYQKLFQAKSPLPVYLRKGKSDVLLYKGMMTASVVGLVIAAFGMYKMAMPSRAK